MKHLIIVVGTMMLGCIIFSMILGDNKSLKASCSRFIEENVELYKESL